MTVPPNAYPILIGAALLFGSIGLAIAIVWVMRKQPTELQDAQDLRKENGNGRSRELQQQQGRGRGLARPMKRVYPIHEQVGDRVEDEEAAERDEVEEEEAAEEEAEARDVEERASEPRKPHSEEAKPETGERIEDLHEIPNFIALGDALFTPYLRPIGSEEAHNLHAQGGLVYRTQTGNKLERLHGRKDFPAENTEQQNIWGTTYYALDIPPEKSTGESPRVFTGTVLQCGAAPYQFDKHNKNSFFVKLAVAGRQKPVVLWGVDLPRALEAGEINLGDVAELRNLGSRWVDIQRDRSVRMARRSSGQSGPR